MDPDQPADEDLRRTVEHKRKPNARLQGADGVEKLGDVHSPDGLQALGPDGGLRAWSTVCGAWLVEFSVVGVAASFGAMHELYAKEYLSDYSPSIIAWIGSVQIFMQYVLGLVSGRLMDTGRFRTVSIGGSL